jgi:hypothetical protein
MTAVRFLDIGLVVVTAPAAILLGAPALGIVVGAVVWVVQRVAALLLEARARQVENVRAAVGLNLFGAFGRAWLVGLAILLVGQLGSRDDGLAAAILVLVAFTIYFATTIAMRAMTGSSAAV